jgi:hypothetical protein
MRNEFRYTHPFPIAASTLHKRGKSFLRAVGLFPRYKITTFIYNEFSMFTININ